MFRVYLPKTTAKCLLTNQIYCLTLRKQWHYLRMCTALVVASSFLSKQNHQQKCNQIHTYSNLFAYASTKTIPMHSHIPTSPSIWLGKLDVFLSIFAKAKLSFILFSLTRFFIAAWVYTTLVKSSHWKGSCVFVGDFFFVLSFVFFLSIWWSLYMIYLSFTSTFRTVLSVYKVFVLIRGWMQRSTAHTHIHTQQ